MSRNIPGQFPPTVGFEAPLEMLSACHGRIEDQCATLRRLQAHLADHGSDEQARAAAWALIRYFDLSAQQHHHDEEQDLFPALVESIAGSDPMCLRELTWGLYGVLWVIIVANLAPRKMRGLESHGMLLAASHGEDGKPILATFAEGDDIELGSRLK